MLIRSDNSDIEFLITNHTASSCPQRQENNSTI